MNSEKSGVFYVTATPIGNLGDITIRALDILKEAEVVFCEDTRVTQKLLNRYDIHTKLKSCHKFSEKKMIPQISAVLDSGKDAVLVSDAGTPLISDPGFVVVEELAKEGYTITPLPGASALTTALCVAGLDTSAFSFYGFLPKKEKEKKDFLSNLIFSDNLSVFYESFARVTATLKVLSNIDAKRQVVICRELTKKYEEILRGTPEELLAVFEEDKVKLKGEFVFVIDKKHADESDKADSNYDRQQIKGYLKKAVASFGLSRKDAVEFVARGFNLPKKLVYSCNIEVKRELENE